MKKPSICSVFRHMVFFGILFASGGSGFLENGRGKFVWNYPGQVEQNCMKCVEKGNYFNIEELSRNSQKLNCMSWKQIAAQILDRRVIGVHFVCPFITFRCADPFYEGSYTAGSLQCGFPGKHIFLNKIKNGILNDDHYALKVKNLWHPYF